LTENRKVIKIIAGLCFMPSNQFLRLPENIPPKQKRRENDPETSKQLLVDD